MNRSIEGRVVAITGAASGIGRALALQCAQRGCRLALSDVDEEGLTETEEAATPLGGRVHTTVVDVADRAEVEAWAESVVAHYGEAHIIINNAGVALGATLDTVSYEDFEWLMNINFWGVVYGTRAFLPHLKAAGYGHVVNVSSVFGIISVPTQGVYNAAKFAVRGYTEALREELDMEDSCVSATCVHPGGIRTNIARNSRTTGIDRFGDTPEQVADRFDRVARTTPEAAAISIVRGIERNKRRVLIGKDAYAIDLAQRSFPTAYQGVLSRIAKRRIQR